MTRDADEGIAWAQPVSGSGQAVEEGVRQPRPRRVPVGELGYEPLDAERPVQSADRMRARLSGLDAQVPAGRLAPSSGSLLRLLDDRDAVTDQSRVRIGPLDHVTERLRHSSAAWHSWPWAAA